MALTTLFDNKPEEIVETRGQIIKEIRNKSPTTKILPLAVFPRDRDAKHIMRKRINGIYVLLPNLADGTNVVSVEISSIFLDTNGTFLFGVSIFALYLEPEGYRR